MTKKLFLIGLLLSCLVLQTRAQTETRVFSGTIGESRVEMTLQRNGGVLSGTYFYQKIGKNLKLSGAIDREGKFTLTETSPAGAKTGAFSGSWSKAEETDAAVLNGEWKDPKGERSLDFYLTEQMIFFTSGARLAPKSFSEKNKAKLFDIEAEYPELSGVSPAAAAALFNRTAREMVMSEIAKFRKDFLAQSAEDLKFAKERGVGNTVEISYNIAHADERLISVWFGNYFYTGGAHPNSYSFTLNFDLREGRVLNLADLFRPNSGYLKTLSERSIDALKARLGEDGDAEWIETGAGAEAENFKSWNITRRGITIYFDSYQVAPYVAGPQEVTVEFEKLEGLLRPEYAGLKKQ